MSNNSLAVCLAFAIFNRIILRKTKGRYFYVDNGPYFSQSNKQRMWLLESCKFFKYFFNEIIRFNFDNKIISIYSR